MSAKLTNSQLALLAECCNHDLCENYGGHGMIRLGGHGMSPLPFRRSQILKLEKLDLLEGGSVFRASKKGRALAAELAGKESA